MSQLSNWLNFTGWLDLAFATVAALLVLLLIIWWQQQTRHWFRVAMGTLLIALLLNIGSFYFFEVPAYYASCPAGCPGWRGYPRPFATVPLDGRAQVQPLLFGLNWLMLWLFWLVATLVWYWLGVALQWPDRSLRTRLLIVLLLAILPWALLPRFLEPPQPRPSGEDLRLAINARRAAEFTYRVTGFQVQRLALEDVRRPQTDNPPGGADAVGSQVCLRGYAFFYLPWRRYLINLDPSGVTALSMRVLPLRESCWGEKTS
jgi:hypothetical protein